MPAIDCANVQQQLSAYHDDELSLAERRAVAMHLQSCRACAEELAAIQSLSRAWRQLPSTEVPPIVWSKIEQAFGVGQSMPAGKPAAGQYVQRSDSPGRDAGRRRRSPYVAALLSMAVSALLLVGLGWWVSEDSSHERSHHSAEFLMTMDRYLDTLPRDPEQAKRMLVEKYQGQSVEPEAAVRLVGYRPVVAGGLPAGYSMASTSVLRMPCCTCVKTVCQRNDGSTLVLFEHDDEETDWFGRRPTRMGMCGDKSCCLVQLDTRIAATWRQGPRSITAIGLKGRAEAARLVDWFDKT